MDELLPLMVHTVTVGNLSHSWENYSQSIHVREDLRTAFGTSALIGEIVDVHVHDTGHAYVQFNTYTQVSGEWGDSIGANIFCVKKEEQK